MDWAEELKMSIRKTTARKGRRSKSRDILKDQQSSTATSTITGTDGNKDISIDITLDMQQNSGTTGTFSSVSTSPHTSAIDSELKRPPVRRISGRWADSGGLKGLKSKKGSFEDERFQFTSKSTINSQPDDEIPIIPDLDDIKDEVLLNEIVEPPSLSLDRLVTLKELNSDLLSQNAFSAVEDVDLSILTNCLQTQDSLDEVDEVWEWNKLFTDISAEIHSDKSRTIPIQKIEIGPDEIPPTMHM